MTTIKDPVFLLGAGFNADVAAEFDGVGSESIAYPLVGDLARLCFDLHFLPNGASIEELSLKSEQKGNFEPLRRLYDRLMNADYSLVRHPLYRSNRNCYSKFFDHFANSNFLTFNCDSLPELFLLYRDRWYPYDGYGVEVQANTLFNQSHVLKRPSACLVLHLHGTLCLYPSPFTFERRPGDTTLGGHRVNGQSIFSTLTK